MTKLWSKSQQKLHPAVEKYTVGSDYVFDMHIMPFDIIASKAHAKGLQKIGILTAQELRKIGAALGTLEKKWAKGQVKISVGDEDCHTVIENYLIKTLGNVGKKIHTGRSRNDQVLVALRLYMKAHILEIRRDCIDLAAAFLQFAKKYQTMPMPGYSHTQQAMLTTVGHYMSSFVESLLDDADFLAAIAKHIDKNPLGSAAGFGTSIPVDRKFTSKELGFAATQINSLYCQNSRGKFDSLFLEGLVQVMLTLGKFANDMLIFTSNEFDYFSVDDSLITGSSIMPHKRNLDAMEILRGNVSVLIANQLMIKDISKNLLSGYNRDFQLLKKPLIESVEIVEASLVIAQLMIGGIIPKPDSIRSKINSGIYTADIANALVKVRGVPFRDAYKQAAGLAKYPTNLAENIDSKVSLGAPGNIRLSNYAKRIKKMRSAF